MVRTLNPAPKRGLRLASLVAVAATICLVIAEADASALPRQEAPIAKAGIFSSSSSSSSSPQPTGHPRVSCPDSELIVEIEARWRDAGYGGYTKFGVVPDINSRLNIIGGGDDLVTDFLACLQRFDQTGQQTVIAKARRTRRVRTCWLWHCFYTNREIATTVEFNLDSTSDKNWATFIDQLQCHDMPPGIVEAAQLMLRSEGLGGETWDLGGSRNPTRNRWTWITKECNW